MVFPTPPVPPAIAMFTIVLLKIYRSGRSRTFRMEGFSRRILYFDLVIPAKLQERHSFLKMFRTGLEYI